MWFGSEKTVTGISCDRRSETRRGLRDPIGQPIAVLLLIRALLAIKPVVM